MGTPNSAWFPARNEIDTPEALQRTLQATLERIYALQKSHDQGMKAQAAITRTLATSLNPASIAQALSANGSAPVQLTGLTGVAAQPQLAGVPAYASLPISQDPNSQNGALISLNGVLYRFNQPVPTGPAPGQFVIQGALAVVLEDTHTNRLANFPASSYPIGAVFYETDRTVYYINEGTFGSSNWFYSAGQMVAPLASRPADLGVDDAGFLFIDTDIQQLQYWSGTTWIPIGGAGGVNAQTVNYAFVAADATKLVTFNGSTLTGTLASPPPSPNWFCFVQNLNSTALTIARNARQINGGTSNLILAQFQWAIIFTDGTNYFASTPIAAGTNITITQSSIAQTIAASSVSIGGVNVQTTSYTPVLSDAGKLITFSGSTLTCTLPNPPLSATFFFAVQNLNASPLTVSRNLLNINGAGNDITLQQFQIALIWTDNSNYFATVPLVAGTGIALSPASNQLAVSAVGGSSAQVLSALASGNLTLTTSLQDIPNCSLTLNLAGTWVIFGSATINAYFDDAICFVRLNVGGSLVSGIMEVAASGSAGLNAFFQAAYTWVVVAVGTTTVAKLQATKTNNIQASAIESAGSAIVAVWLHA